MLKSRIVTGKLNNTPLSGSQLTCKSVLTLYQQLYDSIHAKSGQSSPLKLVYVKTDHEACLAWVSSLPSELRCSNSGGQVSRAG